MGFSFREKCVSFEVFQRLFKEPAVSVEAQNLAWPLKPKNWNCLKRGKTANGTLINFPMKLAYIKLPTLSLDYSSICIPRYVIIPVRSGPIDKR